MIYYHNPRCSKSRQGLALLNESGMEPEIREYLKTGLGTSELDGLFKRLGKEPSEVVRSGESVYKELDLKNKNPNRKEWLKIISENPILLERPILDTGAKAIIGRPPESLLEIL